MQERFCTVCDRALFHDERFVCKICLKDDHEASSHSLGRRVAYALATFPLDVVHRGTIRAMLPVGRIKGQGTSAWYKNQLKGREKSSKNTTSYAYADLLKRFDRRGWIGRGREFLLIKDRQPLMDFAIRGLDMVPAGLLEMDAAIRALQSVIDDPSQSEAWREQRRQELLAIKRIMEQTPQPAGKRGTESFRPIGLGGTL